MDAEQTAAQSQIGPVVGIIDREENGDCQSSGTIQASQRLRLSSAASGVVTRHTEVAPEEGPGGSHRSLNGRSLPSGRLEGRYELGDCVGGRPGVGHGADASSRRT